MLPESSCGNLRRTGGDLRLDFALLQAEFIPNKIHNMVKSVAVANILCQTQAGTPSIVLPDCVHAPTVLVWFASLMAAARILAALGNARDNLSVCPLSWTTVSLAFTAINF